MCVCVYVLCVFFFDWVKSGGSEGDSNDGSNDFFLLVFPLAQV